MLGIDWLVAYPLLDTTDSFKEVIFKMCSVLDENYRSLFIMTLWSIWRRHNDKLWRAIVEQHSAVVCRATSVLGDWRSAQGFRANKEDHMIVDEGASPIEWSKPLARQVSEFV